MTGIGEKQDCDGCGEEFNSFEIQSYEGDELCHACAVEYGYINDDEEEDDDEDANLEDDED